MSVKSESISVLIYGTGSIGAIVAYLLSKSIPEANIYAICRSNYAAAVERGFHIESSLWGIGLVVRPVITQSVEDAVKLKNGGRFDYVFITTKATPTCVEGVAIRPAVSPNTAIVILQNGIAIEDQFRELFPWNPIVSGVLYTPVSQKGPTSYIHTSLDQMYLGTFPANAPPHHSKMADQLVSFFRDGGATAKLVDDIQVERWRKLLINGSENPICALCRLRDARFFQSSSGATSLMRDVMSEIAATARSAGYEMIDENVVQKQLDLLTARPLPGVMPSMMADALSGRQMEVGVILGNTVKIAQKHGVATPLLDAILVLTAALNASMALNERGL